MFCTVFSYSLNKRKIKDASEYSNLTITSTSYLHIVHTIYLDICKACPFSFSFFSLCEERILKWTLNLGPPSP